jgi:hypothetical protein
MTRKGKGWAGDKKGYSPRGRKSGEGEEGRGLFTR